ncbi:glycerate dehydrogenase [Rhodoblastus acidophilus]|uniref:D-2-hydroxyacid dehydrogenase n=1 Tax=Rhodoblastus acidophilus TaxID=1074 RepID=UPI0022253E7C|nr:D-2-hydroxyacid dehydrogenase [Rhodoblastus acidophilus]MCW2285520.1 glycerate dehydrogenase [Rhodoblastus acidophilus]MCW2334564.1 glycerate dehydrogenase [Rhodoblastus acidophilus]
MHKIVFLDAKTLAPGVRLPKPKFPHRWINHESTAPDQLAAHVGDAEIVVVNKVRIGARELDALPGVKLIAISATGHDNVDVSAARAKNVGVTNIRGYSVGAVPDHVFALILALSRNILAYANAVGAGRWQEAGQFCFHDFPIFDLSGKRLGLIGSGSLGSRVAEIGRAFGMDVVFAARRGAPASEGRIAFDELLATSEVISLHCPLNAETENLLSDREFALMAKKPLLINTARGGIVDEAALERALDAGHVAGAGIDVTRPEPPPADSAIMRLAQRPNVLVTPHVGWASLEAQQTLLDQLGEVLESFVAGGRMNRLD